MRLDLKQVFGSNVKYYRYQRKFTQEKLSEIIDLNLSYLSQIENGNYGPSFEKIETIAKALRVEPFELFIRKDHAKLPPRVDMTFGNDN